MIYDEYYFDKVSPDSMDLLWEAGFRHFGNHFFRYSIGVLKGEYAEVLPLRILLNEFKLSKSQKKTIRKNQDLQFFMPNVLLKTGLSLSILFYHLKIQQINPVF